MFERLSNDDVANALAELIACLGVKEEIPSHVIFALLRKKDAEGCVQEIATRLGLPIRISLSYVPKDFRQGDADGFVSSALARTKRAGRGTEGITAQVYIPEYLPMFGTPGLQGYQIRVRVSENCHAHPDTFVAIMAHELSHVLLASLWSPHKDSELHTDLVPILLGFRGVAKRGRKTIERTKSGRTTTTHTTTYGYLTDAQFEFASNFVAKLLQQHALNKKRLLEVVERVRRNLRKAVQRLAKFGEYYDYLDNHPPKKMRRDHAERLVSLHGHDYSQEWKSQITAAEKNMKIAEAFVRPLNHYTASVNEQLKAYTQMLKPSADELGQVAAAIAKDERILRKYVGFTYRLRRVLWRSS